jgi:hypothetical protein
VNGVTPTKVGGELVFVRCARPYQFQLANFSGIACHLYFAGELVSVLGEIQTIIGGVSTVAY